MGFFYLYFLPQGIEGIIMGVSLTVTEIIAKGSSGEQG